eukprot:jgi/Picsp_1/3961/NSC_01473-R1_d-alanine--d-alanine ligase
MRSVPAQKREHVGSTLRTQLPLRAPSRSISRNDNSRQRVINGTLGEKNGALAGLIVGNVKSGRGLGSTMNKGLSRDDVGAALPDAFDAEGRKTFILEEMTYEQLSEFHMRLSENDVEYHDLKSMCKLNGLGGKDMKYNLRAKLIRKVREMLGKPVWDRRSYGRRVKLPTAMTDAELAKFYKQREVVMPEDKDDAIGLSFAMLVVDGAISQDLVPTTSAYDKLNTKRLIQLCQKTQLPTKGNKAELLARLVEYDAQKERKLLADRAALAARRELDEATIDVPPRPPNRAMATDLREAQLTMASVNEMDLPFLRAALLARNLPVYGTSEVLVERLTNVLRRDVIDAHAGLGRMLKYAEAAVSKLSPEEVYESLAGRGLAGFSMSEDANSRLANALVEEWIHSAMLPSESSWSYENDTAVEDEEKDAEISGKDLEVIDPKIDVFLLCDGATTAERNGALKSARAILPILQSDQIWGTLMPYVASSSSSLQTMIESFDDNELPNDTVDIVYLTPTVNGVVATLSMAMAPQGCIFEVSAIPVDSDSAAAVTAEGCSQDIIIQGLDPGTAYEFNAALVNKVGKGPPGEPYFAATLLRQGISVSVLYPVDKGNGGGSFVALTWEELHAFEAEALDSMLLASSRASKNLEEIMGRDEVVLPLGNLASVSSDSIDKLGEKGALKIAAIANDRVKASEVLAQMGYNTVPILRLDNILDTDFKEVTLNFSSWASENSIHKDIGRVAVKMVSNTETLATISCRGFDEVFETVEYIQKHADRNAVDSVELEPIYDDAIFLQVVVLEGDDGIVALMPTEISDHDVSVQLAISDLEIAKASYIREGYDSSTLERLVRLQEENLTVATPVTGGSTSETQQTRHITPPSSLSVETTKRIRLIASKLFKDLKLRDFAKFTICLRPENGYNVEKDAIAWCMFKSGKIRTAEETIKDGNEIPDIKSFSDLLKIDQEANESRNKAEALALETRETNKVEALISEVSGVASSIRYGEVFGYPLDDRTRLDILAEAPPKPSEAIPDNLPDLDSPDGLPDISGMQQSDLCNGDEFSEYAAAMIYSVQIIPELGHLNGIISQQLAASGIPGSWLPRRLVSLACKRQNLPVLGDERVSKDEIQDADENWVGKVSSPATDGDEEMSFEEMGNEIQSWECSLHGSQQAETQADVDRPNEGSAHEISGLDPELEEMDDVLEKSAAALNKTDAPNLTDMGSDASEVLATQFPGLHPRRQRVWILCSGEGVQRDENLERAAEAMRALQGASDLLLETFVLDFPFSGEREDERLSLLIQKREDLLKAGANDGMLFSEAPHLHPVQIRYPTPLLPQDVNRRGVWRMAGTNIVRDTVADLRHGIDKVLEASKTSLMSRKHEDAIHQREKIVYWTKKELELAGISTKGGRSPWGGSLAAGREEGVPQYSLLRDWVSAASERCVAVLMILPGHPSAYGALQELMDEYGVPYTGPSSIAADLCNDRTELLRALTDAVNYDGSIISAPPAHSISALELGATCQSIETSDEFFAKLFGQWENKMLTIRPARDSGQGVARIKSGADLKHYNDAVQNWFDVLEAENNSVETADIQMPLPPPTRFVIEPFLTAVPIQLESNTPTEQDNNTINDAIFGPISWPTKDSWLEARGCLLGGAGTMRCLGVSTPATKPSDKNEYGESSFNITPIPRSILPEEISNDIMLRLQLVADRLGLSGAAEIALLINAATGEIVINEVDVHPDISPGGLLVKQAALMSPPMSHVEVLRELLKESMSRGEESLDAEASLDSSTALYPMDEFSASMTGILDAPDAPNPTQNYFGDPYLKVEDGYQYGFEGLDQQPSSDDEEEDENVLDDYDAFDSFEDESGSESD